MLYLSVDFTTLSDLSLTFNISNLDIRTNEKLENENAQAPLGLFLWEG